MKKIQALIDSAIRLFATQGFDGTTTLEIAKEAEVTEPLIYYHFEGKDDLFVHALETAFSLYLSQLDALFNDSSSEFDKIIDLIEFHFQIVDDLPYIARLVVKACPAKLRDPKGVCRKKHNEARKCLSDYILECLKSGIKSGEFHKLSIPETTHIMIALLNGLLRQRIFQLADTGGVKDATIEFCRRSFLAGAV
jgi:AcrR family transcriptional regulator